MKTKKSTPTVIDRPELKGFVLHQDGLTLEACKQARYSLMRKNETKIIKSSNGKYAIWKRARVCAFSNVQYDLEREVLSFDVKNSKTGNVKKYTYNGISYESYQKFAALNIQGNWKKAVASISLDIQKTMMRERSTFNLNSQGKTIDFWS